MNTALKVKWLTSSEIARMFNVISEKPFEDWHYYFRRNERHDGGLYVSSLESRMHAAGDTQLCNAMFDYLENR